MKTEGFVLYSSWPLLTLSSLQHITRKHTIMNRPPPNPFLTIANMPPPYILNLNLNLNFNPYPYPLSLNISRIAIVVI